MAGDRRYFIPQKYAKPLKQVAIERLARPSSYRTKKPFSAELPDSRSYVVDPVSSISAATKEDDGTVTVGHGKCWICKRQDEESSGSALTNELVYHLDANGERVEVDVYNLCLMSYGGNDQSGSAYVDEQGRYLLATQDVFGDLWVSEVCDDTGGSSSSSGDDPSTSDPPPPGSDKSTAIVPAKFSETGYTALFVAEMPDVRFDEVMIETIRQTDTLIEIDSRFLDVCQHGTVEVISCLPSRPVLLGASVVEEGKIFIQFAEQRSQEVKLAIRLSGIRRGFKGKRFPNRTREQFVANEKWLNKAYPGDKA